MAAAVFAKKMSDRLGTVPDWHRLGTAANLKHVAALSQVRPDARTDKHQNIGGAFKTPKYIKLC